MEGLRAAGGEGALSREAQAHGSKQAFPETLGESVQLAPAALMASVPVSHPPLLRWDSWSRSGTHTIWD